MEQGNRIQRSEVWEQIYKIVKTIPRADCNGMDAPDAPSVATELEKLLLKLLPIQHVSNSLDLRELERKLDEALGKETRETLTEWLKQQRQ